MHVRLSVLCVSFVFFVAYLKKSEKQSGSERSFDLSLFALTTVPTNFQKLPRSHGVTRKKNPGGIFISEKVFDEIKNQDNISTNTGKICIYY